MLSVDKIKAWIDEALNYMEDGEYNSAEEVLNDALNYIMENYH